ncbi:MAG: pseudouridine synthase [Gammaproteobacteria bacterium]
MAAERLQKLLARTGLGSRRQIEDWIRAGRVKINGVPAELGVQVTGRERITVDGRAVRVPTPDKPNRRRVLAYHKPVGEVCTRSDPEGRPTVFASLPRLRSGRWVAIGRLDVNTAGLLLFTTDGELAHRLMHPSGGVEREYAARVVGEAAAEQLQALLRGVELDDGPAHFDRVTDAGGAGTNHWYHVVLSEGRRREVRRLWDAMGHPVSRLIRVRYGPVQLPRRLRPGRWEELDAESTNQLLVAAGLPAETAPARQPALGRRRRRR